MIKNKLPKMLSVGICSVLLMSALSGCGSDSVNLMDDISETPSQPYKEPSAEVTMPAADSSVYTDFAVRLFQEGLESGQNTLISPLSVINALTMTANGAEGETLTQMEQVFGADIASLGQYLHDYSAALPSDENYKLHLANSIWLKENVGLSVKDSFLQANSSLFGADVFKAPFDDSTLKDINSWVSDNTDKMIPAILEEISEDTVMYLINALTFDARWQSAYDSYEVRKDIFTTENGTEKEVEMMRSIEQAYLQDRDENNQLKAQGFMKYYADKKYAFVALLPEEDVLIADYVKSLSGEKLCSMLSNVSETYVEAGLPKFQAEYSVEMKNLLSAMGMPNAFDSEHADFTGMGTCDVGNLYIGQVIHKTYIAVDELGTKAAAATAVEIKAEGAALIPDSVSIVLDRPFVYMIVDCENNLPIFMGSMLEP